MSDKGGPKALSSLRLDVPASPDPLKNKCWNKTRNKHSLNFLCKYKSSDLHKSLDISIKMYQMDDKVFLTKKRKKNENFKSNITDRILHVFRLYNAWK